jgi:hypothetical protein
MMHAHCRLTALFVKASKSWFLRKYFRASIICTVERIWSFASHRQDRYQICGCRANLRTRTARWPSDIEF